jgi:signal transduction histidine kinase/DNA-binding response OmpR family regulator
VRGNFDWSGDYMLLKQASKYSLQKLLLISLTVTFATVAFITGEYMRNVQTRTLEDSFQQFSQKTFNMLFATSLDAVLSEDQPVLETIVAQSVELDKNIHALSIVNEFDEVLAVWKSEEALSPELKIPFSQDVVFEGESFGTIAIVWDASSQRATVKAHVQKIWMYTISAFTIIALLVMGLVLKLVVSPIRSIHTKLVDLQSGRNGEPVNVTAARELNELGDTVNELGNLMELRVAREKELEMASRSKSEFLANMSHELRTPMNGVLGMLNLLSKTRLDSSQKDCVDTAVSSGKNLLNLINDILDFSKIEAGRMEFEQINFSLLSLVEDTCGALATQAHSKDIELVTDLDFTIPVMVNGDPTRARQVLTNLIGNAIKFTSSGEIVVRTRLESEQSRTVIFEVQDSGVGIPEESLHTIFDSFAQADGSTTRKFGGTGLGLSISKQLVEGLGGEIGVRSVAGQGSTFWFKLPFAACTESVPAKVYNRLVGNKILLLEGNDTARESLSTCLTLLGCEVMSCSSGAKGLVGIEQNTFSAVLIGTTLEDMHGEKFVEVLSNNSRFDQLKLMSLVYMNSKSHSLLANANERVSVHLTKPVKLESLHNTLADLISGETAVSRDAVVEETAKQGASAGSVLVVEDNEINQMVAMGMLESLGFQVTTAENGKVALDTLQENTFDLILMDCQMPEMDGYEATRRIRSNQNSHIAKIPIIALTANAMSGDAEKCFEAGMDDYLAKPFEPELFEQKLQEWVEKSLKQKQTATNAPRKAA